MTTFSGTWSQREDAPELYSGDRMNRDEFHRIYARMPDDFRAELVGGVVYVPSPLKLPHARNHPLLSTLFVLYEARTPGVESCDNATVLLGEEAEPQPDLLLRILPEFGGQSTTTRDEYIAGAPELIAEIAHSSRAIDLHGKRVDYARYGVLEYLVYCLRERQLRWFDLRDDRELQAPQDQVLRLQSFPGLWIDLEGLLDRDHQRLLGTLQQGLDSAEHADFVKLLGG
jgi:hypothetical protein